MGNVTIPLISVISVVITLAGVIVFLYKENKALHKTLLEMTTKFIDATNKQSNTIEGLKKAIEGTTQAIQTITASDLWKWLKAQQFLEKNRKKGRNDDDE